jgi:HlyD family secretion protein
MRRTQILSGLAAVAAVAALTWALRPDPVPVDLVTVARAPMEVTVAAEGITRIREAWSVTAPITGTVARSPVRVGDRVVQGVTEVASIRPAAPAFLDARARRQAEAAVTEAEAAVRLAEVVLAQAEADADFAGGQLDRNRALAARGTIPQRALEDSQQRAASAVAALNAARHDLDLRRATLARMEAQLQGPAGDTSGAGEDDCCISIRAPETGTVLEVADLSTRLVQAGSPLLTIGDLDDLQIEVDLLSTDAVRVSPGATAHVERWGGPGRLLAQVDRIDPSAFTRVSALGIEEQRVRLHLDFLSPPQDRGALGDRYRVFVRVVVWSGDAVLQVPQSALFRDGAGWAVFRAVDGRAVRTAVDIGHTQDDAAEVLAGLAEGAQVIAYPGNRIADGARIMARVLP